MKTAVVEITASIIAEFLPRMSEDDREELARLGGDAKLEHLVACSCHTFAGIVDGEPTFIGGVAEPGQVWMLVSQDVRRARRFFLRVTRDQTNIMAQMFPLLTTYEEATDARSLRWLEWLGFQPVDTEIFNGRPVFRMEA